MSPTPAASSHQQRVREQFTRQAVPFSRAPAMRDEGAIALLTDAARIRSTDRSLDVACGPGLVALAFARHVEHATGIAATPAMIARARALQVRTGAGNLQWDLGDACALPYPDGQFDIVTSRFAWHHLEHPGAAMREMLRVCRRGGRVLVCDGVASAQADKAAAFNRMERMRDPSTVSFLTEAQLLGIVGDAGLEIGSVHRYRVPVELEGLLRVSFPAEADVGPLRQMIIGSVRDDSLGMGTAIVDGEVRLHYPAVIVAGQKA